MTGSLRILSLAFLILVPSALMYAQQPSSAKQVVAFAVHRPSPAAAVSVFDNDNAKKVTVLLMNVPGSAGRPGTEKLLHVDLSAMRPTIRQSIVREKAFLTVTD